MAGGDKEVCCRSCGAAVGQTLEGQPARCPGCGRRVCVGCGCTEERACTKPCTDGALPCSWDEGRPELCLFCVWDEAARLYEEAAAEGRIVVPGGGPFGLEELFG